MLDINPLLLGLTLAVFLVLIALLNSWLYNPLLSYMEKRDNDIKKDLSEVGSNDDEITSLHAQADKIISDAKAEATALREKVVSEAKELSESKIEAKKAELAKKFAAFTTSLNEEKESLNNALLSEVPLFKEAIKAKISKI
ncbi:F0F1 ATP synthase subunit B' [Sulfurimonas sp. MAG313]|nr:FoF1 ATP synthase subunit B' [Sulfurimonas sp. MAG313]MDF1880512.1 F0F1 ATP synthase subunit B' [Sulfurimonas sp. MAG313]